MAETSDRVMAMVEKELQADPGISNEDLRRKAERLDPAIASLSARAFNARYPLQVKRRSKPRRPRAANKGARGGTGRKSARGGARATGRKAAATKGTRKRGSRGPGRPRKSAGAVGARRGAENSARGRVRATLLDFARDLASSDGAGLVDVIAGVDDYVERIMKEGQRAG